MDLVYKNERTLFGLMLALSAVMWVALLVGTVGAILVYGLIFFLAYVFAHSALIAHIKGNAVRITEQQFPDLHRQIAACCEKLGHADQPDAYLMQMGGSLNAFATRFLGRDFLVLYSDVVDALADNPDALNFYIGHEIGHIKRRHLVWATVLAPASLLPLVGAAYSRAREYTCDRHGLAACENPVNAEFGMAALAAGGKRWKTMSKTAYIGQAQHTNGFWMSFHELVGDYPWLVKRMDAIRALARGQQPSSPRRHPIAFLLALLVPRLGAAGGGGLIATIAIVGVLAAVAVPAYQQYVHKAQVASAHIEGTRAANAVARYYVANGKLPETLEAAGVSAHPAGSAEVDRITLNRENAHLSVFMHGEPNEAQGVLEYTPSRSGEHRIDWKCSAEGLRPGIVPPDCR
jgi:Zn-dependent protease with chaperone function/Tfp pilus assembly major pilin PilA